MTDNEHYAEHGLGAEVKDTIEDCLRIRSNDVATLAYTPRNVIAKPEEQGPDPANQVNAIYVTS